MNSVPLPSPRAPGRDALAKARAAMVAEAARPRPPGWKESLALVAGVGVVLLAVIATAGVASGSFPTDVIGSHVPAMALLGGVAVVLWVSAFVPAGRTLRFAALIAGVVAMVALVLLRADLGQADTSRFTCTLSHLGVALVPAIVTLIALRRAAFNPLRAFAAGLGVGALGAFAGELGCHQGPVHVLLFHLPAWALSTVVIAFLSSKLTPRSFAP